MKKRLLALNLVLVLLLTLVPTVSFADGSVVLAPDADGNPSAEYYVNEDSDYTTEFKFTPTETGIYRLQIWQPQAQPVSGESLVLYRSGDNAEVISFSLKETTDYTKCVLKAGVEYTFKVENNQAGQHSISLRFIEAAEYAEAVEISSANFPDAAFRQYVERYDINQNGLLDADELAAIYSLYICSSQSFPIQSLNGIEKFIYTKHISIDTDYTVDSDSSVKELPALPNGIESLNIRTGYLEKLPDLSVYTNLRFFNCSYNQITSLSALPNGLLELDCRGNQITEWPELPASLFWLDCSSNQLTMLPELPNGLEYLDCSYNELTSLPTLPDGLLELYCSGNQIAEWPELPDSLFRFGCSSNQLTMLPDLPNGLEYLDCSVNQITEWPELPDSLFRLYCSNNQLTMLPDLPSGLQTLHCGDNQLTSLPTLPDGLQEVYCCNNPLAEFPTLPDSLTTIGYSAFAGCSSLTDVTIPDSVTTIGDGAFGGCSSLTNVTIPDSVTTIGDSAFHDCSSLTSVTIPDGVTTIGRYAFSGCSSLTSVTIPDGVTEIGDSAFYDCRSLTSVTVPASLTTVGERAFYGCSSICNVSYKGNSEQWNNIDIGGGNEWFTQTFSGKVDNVEWSYDDGVLTISGTGCILDGPWKTFSDSITRIVIEAGITAIGNSAFSCCSRLANVTISDSVTVIGDSAFSDCTSLTNITIPSSVTSIGNDVFWRCEALKSVTIPSGVTTIGDRAFEYCHALDSIAIPDSVTAIGDDAFSNCGSLTDINYSGTDEQWNAIDIGEGNNWLTRDFSGICGGEGDGTNLKWQFDDGVLTISGNGSMTNVTERAPWAAFTDFIIRVEIADGVTTIGNLAFWRCFELTSVSIPNSVITIGEKAFLRCISLTDVIIPDSVTTIGEYAFKDCSFTDLTIPSSVKTMGICAFEGCGYLENVTILDGVEAISDWAFTMCMRLKSVTIPSSVKSIGNQAFDGECELTVYFNGTQEQWNSIEIGERNQPLRSAEIIFTGVHTHTTETINYVAPTCTEDGYTGDEVCTVCGETVSTGEVIAATGHSYGDDNVCDDCGHKQSVSEAIQTWISDTIQTIRNFFDKIFGRG